MIYLELLCSFLKIGLFSFGGAYGAIPLIQEEMFAKQWADPEMFANLVALTEMTPGPIMVNMATYVGSRQAGLGGAVCATVGVVFPSFVLILIAAVLFRGVLKQNGVQAALKGVRPCLMGVILATGLSMAASICVDAAPFSVDYTACAIFLLLAALLAVHRVLRKKEFPPAVLILVAAACGCAFY